MTPAWHLLPRRQRCMHCLRNLYQNTDGIWVDSDGIDVCIIAHAGPMTPSITAVYHTPLPQI